MAIEGMSERTLVLFGNSAPMMHEDVVDEDGNISTVRTPAKHIQQSETRVDMWPGFDDAEFVNYSLSTDNDRMLTMIGRGLSNEDKKYAVGLNELEQIVAVHFGNSAPDWVSCSDPEFARVISEHFKIPLGQPTALLTTAGRDALLAQHLTTAAQPAAFNYMALSADTATELASNTSLPGEITTVGGGLLRAQCTYAHTAGTNTATLTHTYTANGSDTLPVVVAKIGVTNAATAGTLAYEKKLSSTATLNISGDSLALTDTITGG